MSDLISRQAAVDAFDGVKVDEDYCTEYDIGYNDGIDFTVSKLSLLPSAKTEFTTINKFIDGLEEIFADIRESHIDDSVCGLCEFDGAYVGESGDWCNECPGFYRDDCFKLRDRIREKWIAEITNTAISAQDWIPVTERLPEEHYDDDLGMSYSDPVLATFGGNTERDPIKFWTVIVVFTKDGKWMHDIDRPVKTTKTIGITAWMPWPEPYKEVDA